MNIFVTGASGFIGKHLLASLTEKLGSDDKIFALVRKHCRFEDPRIIPLKGGLDQIGQYSGEMLSCCYVFHLAANAVFGDKADYDADNHLPVVAMTRVLKSSSTLLNFVFLSTIGAVDRDRGDTCSAPLTVQSPPNPRSRYGQSKLRAEQHLGASGIPHTIIRPTWVYGRGMRPGSHINNFVTMVYRNSPISRLHFPGRVSLIHVEDLARALANVIHNPSVINKTYFAETEALSLGDIFSIIVAQVYGKSRVQVPVPRLRGLIGRLHSRLPLAVANLFVDYLLARDDAFRRDFGLESVRLFAGTVGDVISANPWNGAWVITGANSGIGYEMACQLRAMGKALILIDKSISNLGGFADHEVIQADLTDGQAITEIAGRVAERMLFCLVNNAGLGARGSIQDLDVTRIREVIEVNACYPVLFTKSLLDALTRNNSIIVNMASSIAYNPLPNMSIYSASKAFLANWSESLSYELRDTNRVLTVSPAGTLTNFQQTAGVKVLNDGKGLLTPSFVAGRIIHTVLHTRKKILILGASSQILLAVTRLLPRTWNIIVWGKLFERLR